MEVDGYNKLKAVSIENWFVFVACDHLVRHTMLRVCSWLKNKTGKLQFMQQTYGQFVSESY
jgi:hypothetical protein